MRGTVTRQIALLATLVVAATTLPFFAAPVDAAQRPFTNVDGTDCLVVTGAAPTGAPRVLGSRQPLQESYGEGDELFVGGEGVADLSVGDRLQFVRAFGSVRHPDTDVFISEVIGWIGFAEVIAVGPDRAIVTVTKSCREIEPGEYLLPPTMRDIAHPSSLPPFEPNRLITPNAADPVVILGELESILSDSGKNTVTAAREAYGQRDTVIIDQGSDSGWAPGDLVDMYRAELELRVLTGGEDYTPMPLALGMVVAVGDTAAAVLIVEGDMSVQIGDRVQRLGRASNDR